MNTKTTAATYLPEFLMLKHLSVALIFTGILHNILGFITMRTTLRRLWQEGILATVRTDDASYALLWFLTVSFALMLIGAAYWQLADASRLDWLLILALFLLAAAICVVYPKPGPRLLLMIAAALVIAKACGAG